MAVRIQLRRDTAANWTSNNPTLREGEIGIETDTLKMKVGNGSSTWTQITSYANVVPGNLNTTLNGYVEVTDIGAENGVAGLNGLQNLLIPNDSIIFEGATEDGYETTLTVTDPTQDRTITFPNATGTVALTTDITSAVDAITTDVIEEGSTNKYFTDERAQDAIATAIAAGTHTNITITYDDSTNKFTFVGANTYSDENAQDAVGNAVGTGLSYNDSTGAISVDTATIQARVADVSDTEIGYLNGVTSAIQTQIDSKLSTSTASSTYQPIVSGVSDTEIGYLNGVTSAIQTQLDNKLSLSGGTLTGALTLSGAPSSALHAATKAYVDNTTAGLNFHAPAHAATTANLSANYSNGTDGVGATLTADTNRAWVGIDSHTTFNIGNRILIKNQTTALQNGIYTITDLGSVSSPWVLTRATDADNSPAGEMAYGDFCFVQNGGQAGFGFIVNTTGTITIGSTSISYVQFNAGQVVVAGNGLTEPTPGTLAIDTTITADLSTAQTLTNKTINANANTITVTSANVSDFNEAAQDAIGNAVGTGLTYTDSTGAISVDTTTIQARVTDVSDTEIGYLNGVTSSIQTQLDAKAPINAPTFTGTVSGITATMVGLGNVDNTSDANKPVSTATQTALDLKVDESLFDTKGDILVASADNTPAKLAVGTNGYLLTANSSATNGIEWAAAPVSLPTQTGNNGKYLTTDGSTASWATLVVPIETGTATVTANTASTVDTTALSAFTSIEYMVSLKQGSKIRTSKVVVQTDGTSVDMTEFAITETGGTIAGVVVSAAVSSTNAVLQVTATDATSTNVTVKFSKVKL